GERPDLVRVRVPGLPVDPSRQRLQRRVIVWIDEPVDQQRDAAAGLLDVPVDGVAGDVLTALERRNRVADVRWLNVLPCEVRGVAADGQRELRRNPLPQACETVVEPRDDLNLALQRPASRHQTDPRQRDRRYEPVHRHRPVRPAQGTTAQGLDEARHLAEIGPLQFLEETVRGLRQAEAEGGAYVAVPGAEEHVAETLPLPFGRDHDVHAPGRADFLLLDLKADGHSRVLAHDGLALARYPDERSRRRGIRIPAVLPVPPKAVGFRHVVAEDTAVQRFDLLPILGPVPINLRHQVLGFSGERTYSMLLMRAFCVSGLDPSHRPMAAGIRRTVDVTWSSSRCTRKPAPAIWPRRRVTVTSSSKSSCLTTPFRASRMNEFSCAGSFSVQGAWRASSRNVRNAIARPVRRCNGTGIFSRGRCAPANDKYGAVDRNISPPGFSTR